MRNRSLFDSPTADVPAEPGDVDAGNRGSASGTPLAERMRPRDLDEVVGQEAVVGVDGFLRRAIERDRVPSLIFWGPPGSGKTTLARILATATTAHFLPFSAVTAGIKEIKQVMQEAERWRRSRSVLLFVDEIHRFNRAQQDAFLPFVERGDVVLVGATTENPSFELNGALLSRCRVVVLQPLGTEDIEVLLARALEDPERGLGQYAIEVDRDAIEALIVLAGGDARRALGLLESVVEDAAHRDVAEVSALDVERTVQRRTLLYDKSGEEHFNLISALHKSLRESDPDAAIYWLVRMLESGEEPSYVARRMLRFASEDIGLADPQAVQRTLAAWQGYERLGSPEGDLLLAQAAVDLALAPKSVALYEAYKRTRKALDERPADPVPMAIRNAPTDLMRDVGYGRDYVYAPSSGSETAGLQCLPDALQGERFYRPTGRGAEQEFGRRIEELDEARRRARHRDAENEDESNSDSIE